MNFRHLTVVSTLLFYAPGTALPATPTVLHAVTDSVPPYNYVVAGRIGGFSSDLIDMIAADAGIEVNKQLLPWARAFKIAQAEANTLIYTLVRTPEREHMFQWVGPISKRRVMMYRLAGRKDIDVHNVHDAKSYRIGVVRESASEKYLIAQGFSINKELDLAVDDQSNLRKFIVGRFDLLVSLDWAAAHNAREAGLSPTELIPVLTLDDRRQYWFGVSLRTDPSVASKLNLALENARKDGRLRNLAIRYMLSSEP